MRITDAFRGEHACMRPFLRFVRESTKPGVCMEPALVKSNATALKKIVQAHASIEDSLVFERWKKVPAIRHALNEHKEIEDLLDQAAEEGDQKVLNHAVRLILGHFAEEERDVFPALEKKLPPAVLAQLGVEWAQLRAIKL
jgi:hemerythrin superfamily protein